MIEATEFNITKTCPFLNKLCITEDCPSFTINSHSFRKFEDQVVLVKKKKKLMGTKVEKRGWGLIIGWDEQHIPTCQVLDAPSHPRWHRQTGVPVGDTIRGFSKRYKPEWVKLDGWDTSHREVTELPQIQSSKPKANKNGESNT